MRLADILITVGLVLLVLRQIRPRPLTVAGLLWPVPLVLYGAYDNLHAVPSGRSLAFALTLSCIGLLLGLACGLTTQVYCRSKEIMAHATGIAVFFWLAGMSARLIFAFSAGHGGAEMIARFSAAHQLGMTAWVAGLVGMSLMEVLGRSAVLLWRRFQLRRDKNRLTTPHAR